MLNDGTILVVAGDAIELGQSNGSIVNDGRIESYQDFTRGEDIIDLSRIDANANNALANDAFIFIGAAAFSNVAGQMHAIQVAGNTFIEMDVNGDSVADCVIQLSGLFTLNAGDFVL